MKLVWDAIGEKRYENGVDRGVLYIPDNQGVYNDGVAWNGLTTVTESPSGAESNKQYADNIPYLNIRSAEEFGATVEAFTYPDEFSEFNGEATPTPGVKVGQQNRRSFGLSYRTKVGNDLDADAGYKIHLVYGASANPSEKAYTTLSDSPEAINFSWELVTTPVAVTGLKPSANVTIDSTEVDPDALATLEDILYGTAGVEPRLPLPDEVIALFEGTITEVELVAPAFNAGTNTITIPTTAGITYYIDGVAQVAGPVVITEDTTVEARPNAGYVITNDNDWSYNYTAP